MTVKSARAATEARIRSLLAARTDVIAKTLMGTTTFMVAGAMCCAASDSGLLVRVRKDERDAWLEKPHVAEARQGARIMRGFVLVAPPGYRTDAALRAWLDVGIAAAPSERAGKLEKPRATRPSGRSRAPR